MIGYIVMEGYDYEGLRATSEPYPVFLKREDAEAEVERFRPSDRNTGARYHEIVEVELP